MMSGIRMGCHDKASEQHYAGRASRKRPAIYYSTKEAHPHPHKDTAKLQSSQSARDDHLIS